MNKHEVISRVYDHLMTQQERSTQTDVSEESCLYRYRNGAGVQLACAIGALIDNEHYYEGLEHKGPYSDHVQKMLGKSGIEVEPHTRDAEFLNDLQYVHDSIPIEFWADKLEELADDWEL